MSNTTIGPGGLTEQPVEIRHDIKRGDITVRRWRGDRTSVQQKAALLQLDNWNTSIREGPVWEVEATVGVDDVTGAAEQPQTTWELTGNAYEVDLLNMDVAAVNGLSAHDLKLLRKILDGKWDAGDGEKSPLFTDAGSGDPFALFNLWAAGVKSKQVFQPVLRLNQIVSRQYAIPSSLANVGSVLSTTALLNSVAIPLSISNNLPNSSTVTKTGDSGSIDLYYGWFKHAPTVTQTGWNKIQIAQEWHWGLWSTVQYTVIE